MLKINKNIIYAMFASLFVMFILFSIFYNQWEDTEGFQEGAKSRSKIQEKKANQQAPSSIRYRRKLRVEKERKIK